MIFTLNQYTAIDTFAPTYDLDDNQTSVLTETGVWQVTYNAENRPVRWQSGDTVISMTFDRMGRRVEMRTVTPTSDLLQRFVYKDFLCIQQLRGPDNTPYQTYVWDPTEPIPSPLPPAPSSSATPPTPPSTISTTATRTSPASPMPPAPNPSPTPTPPTARPPFSPPPPSPSPTPSNSPPKSTTPPLPSPTTTTATMMQCLEDG